LILPVYNDLDLYSGQQFSEVKSSSFYINPHQSHNGGFTMSYNVSVTISGLHVLQMCI